MAEDSILNNFKRSSNLGTLLKKSDIPATREVLANELSDIIVKDNLFKDFKKSANSDDKKLIQQKRDFWKKDADKNYNAKLKAYKSLWWDEEYVRSIADKKWAKKNREYALEPFIDEEWREVAYVNTWNALREHLLSYEPHFFIWPGEIWGADWVQASRRMVAWDPYWVYLDKDNNLHVKNLKTWEFQVMRTETLFPGTATPEWKNKEALEVISVSQHPLLINAITNGWWNIRWGTMDTLVTDDEIDRYHDGKLSIFDEPYYRRRIVHPQSTLLLKGRRRLK